jgi:CheY-like chemotaxis protein
MTEDVSTHSPAFVLVVDDDEGILRLARKSLERAGCRVAASRSVGDARARIAEGEPDLLVLDYQLDGPETGLDFFRRLRAEGIRIPAILVTGFTDESRVIEALRAGVSDVVPKSGDYLDYLPGSGRACAVAGAVAEGIGRSAVAARSRSSITARCQRRCRTLCSPATPTAIATFLSKQWLEYTGLEREPCRKASHGSMQFMSDDRDADSPDLAESRAEAAPSITATNCGSVVMTSAYRWFDAYASSRCATFGRRGQQVVRQLHGRAFSSARRSKSASGCWPPSRPRGTLPKKQIARKTVFSRCSRTSYARRSRRCWQGRAVLEMLAGAAGPARARAC